MAVPGERRATSGTTAEAGGASSSPFGGDEILGWLDILLKGKPDQQEHARTEIAMILEARGFAEDAEEAYWTNVQARSTDRRAYDRLIALYQRRKDRLSESLVRKQRDEVFAQPEPPRATYPTWSPQPSRPSQPPGWSQPARQVPQPRPARPHEPNDAPVSVARRLTSPSPQVPMTSSLVPAGQPIRRLRSAPRPETAAPAPLRAADAGPRIADAPSEATAVMPAQVLPAPPSGRRRARLSPNPGPSSQRFGSRGGRLIALRPTTILALLLASVGAAALIVFLLIFWDRGASTRLANAGAGQASARCVDAAVRFPGTHDPRGAVASAYRQQGVDVEANRPGGTKLTVDQAEQVVGGWIGVSLLLEHAGQPAPKLNEWLDSESSRPSLANAIMAGRHLDTMLTPDEWSEIQSWPASTCEGAFVKDPRNAGLVGLMERVVAR